MGIKYGFCSEVKSRRINLGRTTLVCGTNAHVYSTDLTGTVTQSDIGSVSLLDVTSGLCLQDAVGECPDEAGSFYTQTVSYNATVQNNPMMIGCCADHVTHEGYLINTSVGGVTTSREHALSINGQGEPWAVSYQAIIDAITFAVGNLNVITIPAPPNGFYVPTSVDSNMPGDSWQQGSGSWTNFEGLGTDMDEYGDILIVSDQYEYSVSVNTTNGRVDGSQSLNAYYTSGVGDNNIPCDPVEVASTVCDFARELNGVIFA